VVALSPIVGRKRLFLIALALYVLATALTAWPRSRCFAR
jgi:MFS family permease